MLRALLDRRPPRREVLYDTGGFVISENGIQLIQADWARVKEVFAWKDDLFSYDEICIGFRYDDEGTSWWVSEEYAGYEELLKELERSFPGIRTNWFRAVAFPAFAANRTTLWGEPWQPTDEKL